jgi:hypothetical protein
VKKNEIFSRYPLDFFPENSIIGFTLERVPQNGPDETEARETSGKIEGIGDMLSDGPRRFLGSQLIKRRESRPSLLGHDRAEDLSDTLSIAIYGKQDRLF